MGLSINLQELLDVELARVKDDAWEAGHQYGVHATKRWILDFAMSNNMTLEKLKLSLADSKTFGERYSDKVETNGDGQESGTLR